MERFSKVARGAGSITRVEAMMNQLKIVRPLIVGSEKTLALFFRKNPGLITLPVFSGYHPNPDLKDCVHGKECYLKADCDGLISVGGGSCMDTAKAIKALLGNSYEETAANRLKAQEGIPHLCIPATAGTGAEATQFAVVYQEGKKISLDHPSLKPDAVILDPALLKSLPDYHRKSCAMDTLCHGIESYWSRRSDEDSRVHAFLAITGVLDNLTNYLKGDPNAAAEMMDASYQGGKAIQLTRTTAAHAMAYQLTKTYGIAHGHACILTLPALWDLMVDMKETKDVLLDLSSKIRLGDARMTSRLIRGMLFSLGLESPVLRDESELDTLVQSVNPDRLNNHPVALSAEQIREVYRKSFTPICTAEKQACTDIWKYYGGKVNE